MTKVFILLHLFFFGLSSHSWAEKSVPTTSTEGMTRISVLGYHEFSQSQPATEMRLPITKLREQLQKIKDKQLNVITLEDFTDWKKGNKQLPDRSILITIDDGWKSVYTDAFPVLKEFGYPFTLYLYKNYVNGGGKALTTDMIQDMKKSGLCSIGSHSVSHPFPSSVKKKQEAGKTIYSTFLKNEFGESKEFLENTFDVPVTTYAYPGGFHTEEMYDIAENLGYQFLFTVIPGKLTLNSPNHQLNRYIILGTHDYIFENAIHFKTTQENLTEQVDASTPFPVQPVPASKIKSRRPMISVDLSEVTELDADSIELRVSGFGKVPFHFNPNTKKCSWRVNRPIRAEMVEVELHWKILGETKAEEPVRWSFFIDKKGTYQVHKNPINKDPATEEVP